MYFLKKYFHALGLLIFLLSPLSPGQAFGQSVDEIHTEPMELACNDCHQDKTIKPASHRLNWKKSHGEVYKLKSGKINGRCSLCHTEASCRNCHQIEAPSNHTNHWRERGHSINVSIDREKCVSCHRNDFCERCHRTTSPRSHTGTWGSAVNRHCINCHNPVTSEEGCKICHRSTPSHNLAKPLPLTAQPPNVPAHTQGMDCRQCHGKGKPLPHVDNGDSCTQCHK